MTVQQDVHERMVQLARQRKQEPLCDFCNMPLDKDDVYHIHVGHGECNRWQNTAHYRICKRCYCTVFEFELS